MTEPALPLYTDHSRHYAGNRFVYPVLSRRSRGISLGINLNPDKVCNFDCIYCQVDRRSEAETRFVETAQLLAEIEAMLDFVTSGDIYQAPRFVGVPEPLRRLNDLAFSGDGEPTTYRNFDEIVAAVAACKQRRGLDDVKLVLITNASMFHRPAVARGLVILDANQGEVWAKLDAGTDAYYQRVERTKIPFQQILDNLAAAARVRPLVIQSLFLRIDGEGPPPAEIAAFCDRLQDVITSGGRIRLVQVYTVARQPAEDSVSSLSRAECDAIAATVARTTGLPVETYYGTAD